MKVEITRDVRDLERESIRSFLERCSPLLTGRVLDYGCGAQPYRDLVEGAGGSYVGYDRISFPANVSGQSVGPPRPLERQKWDAILCTQLVQYVPLYDEHEGTPLLDLLESFRYALAKDGVLILTGPTNWQETEPEDLSRLTLLGVQHVLHCAGFREVAVESRACVPVPDWKVSLGYGAVARP